MVFFSLIKCVPWQFHVHTRCILIGLLSPSHPPALSPPFPIYMSFVLSCDLLSLPGAKRDHGFGATQWALPFFTQPSRFPVPAFVTCSQHLLTALFLAEHRVSILGLRTEWAPDIPYITEPNPPSQGFTVSTGFQWWARQTLSVMEVLLFPSW